MKPRTTLVPVCVLLAAAGCLPTPGEPPAAPPASPGYSVQRPAETGSAPPPAAVTRSAGEPEVSWDTERDGRYARFLRDHSGGMIRKAAVGIEKHGTLRVEIDRSVAPDDTLPLTRSLMAGARKDFPDRSFILSLYDPDGKPILKARYRPDHGVDYKIVHGDEAHGATAPAPSPSDAAAEPTSRSGVTEADRRFSAWAEDHGRAFLRYVQADLERHGRLWFGVTRDVKPADVPDLTRSLLEGAHKEFPRREIVATVFDPDGEKIGTARLGPDGKVRWER
jgi:hypothetical protein